MRVNQIIYKNSNDKEHNNKSFNQAFKKIISFQKSIQIATMYKFSKKNILSFQKNQLIFLKASKNKNINKNYCKKRV